MFGSLLRNKLRTFLTMAGIAWGIASIVIIVAMGDGFKEGQRNNMKELGENIVILFGGRTEMQAGGQRAGPQDPAELSTTSKTSGANAYLVKMAAAELKGNVRATSPFNSGAFDADGVEAFFNRNFARSRFGEGRWFSDDGRKERDARMRDRRRR